jgi:hypothetical protein
LLILLGLAARVLANGVNGFGVDRRMLVDWPFWCCPQCDARLIPAEDNRPIFQAPDTPALEISEHAA